MRLCEHPEFEQAVLAASEHFEGRGLRAAVIEKDYYVTEALRELAQAHGQHIIFKGGTSLSKGWELINRFSEDIDLFLDRESYETRLSNRNVDRRLADLCDTVLKVPRVTRLEDESSYSRGYSRHDYFCYIATINVTGDVANRLLLESGIASGKQPTEERQLSSYLAQFLDERDRSLDCVDEKPFSMKLLHFRRTFVEKLFAIHGRVESTKATGESLGTQARHYYDLHQLAQQPEVQQMLNTSEYSEIKADYDEISKRYFSKSYVPPKDMDFRNSDALFPSGDLSITLKAEYEKQCGQLCYGAYPRWEDVLGSFDTLRALLG